MSILYDSRLKADTSAIAIPGVEKKKRITGGRCYGYILSNALLYIRAPPSGTFPLAMRIHSWAFLADRDLFASSTSTTPFNWLCNLCICYTMASLHGRIGAIYIFQMNLQIMVRSYIISQLSNRTILRCSPPTGYLYENGKTANSQHPTGKNPSSHVTSHHLSAPEFIQRPLYCVYYHWWRQL